MLLYRILSAIVTQWYYNIILQYFIIILYYRCTCEIKCRTAMAKAAFNKKRALFYRHIGLGIEEEACEVLHLEHSFIWC